MQFKFGEWLVDIDTEATRKHYELLRLQFNDVPSYRRYADYQYFRNYMAYCNNMPSEEEAFFDALGITPEYSRILGSRIDKECNYYIFGNYFIIGSTLRKPTDTIWNEQPDICIGKYQFTVLHPEWYHPSIMGNIPKLSVCIHFYAEMIPWLLEEECEQKYFYGLPKNQKIDRVRKTESKLQCVLKSINSNFRKMSEQESRDYMRQWFKRVVPENKREEAKVHCFLSPIMGGYLWHAFNFEFAACQEESHASELYDALDHENFVLFMNNEKIGFTIENGKGLTSEIINTYKDIIVTDINYKWTYVHTHEPTYGPYFTFL